MKLKRLTHAEFIGLPVRAVALSHSEINDAACPLRWWYGYGTGNKTEASSAIRLGHGFDVFIGDLWGWWKHYDQPYPLTGVDKCASCRPIGGTPGVSCSACSDTGLGPVDRVGAAWLADWERGEGNWGSRDEVMELIDQLRRICHGYLCRYGPGPLDGYRVVDVQVALARPIEGPDGRPFRPRIALVEDGAELRFLRPGDDGRKVHHVRWPWYQVGVLDAVLEERAVPGVLWFGEQKCVADPGRRIQGLTVDPQTSGYHLLLEHHARLGTFGPAAQRRVAAGEVTVGGFLFDVAASGWQYDPEVLETKPKKGQAWHEVEVKLSRATNKTIPSWRYLAALAAKGLNPTDYADVVQALGERYDAKLYQREWGAWGDTDNARHRVELRVAAERHAALRRGVAGSLNPDERAARYPRVPVCQHGGFCDYRGPCASGAPDVPDAGTRGGQRWSIVGAERGTPATGSTLQHELGF